MAIVRHGHATRSSGQSPEYKVWASMLTRCYTPNHHSFKWYGGRGIVVCGEWRKSFVAFLADMGPRPIGTTLDRFPNKDGNYEPGNCRWATSEEQHNNISTAIPLTFAGETLMPKEWADRLNIPRSTIYKRVSRGLPIAQILSTTRLRRTICQ